MYVYNSMPQAPPIHKTVAISEYINNYKNKAWYMGFKIFL